MARIEIGKPILGREFLHVSLAGNCDNHCPLYGQENTRFRCYRYNGDLIIEVKKGITRETIIELEKTAKCV